MQEPVVVDREVALATDREPGAGGDRDVLAGELDGHVGLAGTGLGDACGGNGVFDVGHDVHSRVTGPARPVERSRVTSMQVVPPGSAGRVTVVASTRSSCPLPVSVTTCQR